MSVIKFLRDWTDLFNWSTDENPTTQQDYQEAVKNWVQTIESIVDCTLWQPETTYQVGDTVRTPSLPKYVLLCITAGQSGAAEPDYTDVSSNDEITDGTVVWRVQTTRLGTVLTASGSSTTVNTTVTLCSITTHPAGTWLIVGHMDLNYNGTGTMVNSISRPNKPTRTVRTTAAGGGGNINTLIEQLDEDEVVSLNGRQSEQGTIRGNLQMVQLA